MTHHRLYGYARDPHEITCNLRITDIRRERRIIPDGRKSYLALSDEVAANAHTPLNSWSIRRFAQTDGINKSVAGFVEPMKELN